MTKRQMKKYLRTHKKLLRIRDRVEYHILVNDLQYDYDFLTSLNWTITHLEKQLGLPLSYELKTPKR